MCVYEFILIIGKKIYSERTNNFPGVITYSVFSRCLKKLSCLKPSSDWSPCSPSIATDLLLITVNLSMRSISTNNLSKEEGFLCHPTPHRISTPKGYSFCIQPPLQNTCKMEKQFLMQNFSQTIYCNCKAKREKEQTRGISQNFGMKTQWRLH